MNESINTLLQACKINVHINGDRVFLTITSFLTIARRISWILTDNIETQL